ncbi:MAG TPA: carboxylesterase family protein [Hyphomonadaceae bacterium]|jgi:para-nitrobenzyl esterase|nr:carboxylesterase family protein [Hyphomonadaceae bacterium]
MSNSKRRLLTLTGFAGATLMALLASCATLTPADLSVAAPVASTRLGRIEGVREGDLAIFRGVPFAAPPTGVNRWKPPQPAAGWPEVRPTKAFAPACTQNSTAAAGGVPLAQSSEDCLYLNVWTPAKTSAEKLPVMVWIYGGGFSAGATSVPLYAGDKLATRGVVVVSVAYRLGPMGFLAHPALSAESKDKVSGNYGLMDQIAGLDWVKENIAGFGGDPSKVTIFGESAGGISVSMLAASPLAKGRFTGAISESGGSFGATHSPGLPGENVQRLAQAEKAGDAFGAKLGGTLAAMRAASAADVLAAARGLDVGWPVLDGHVIPDDQHLLYEAGRFNDTPVLIGFNSDEGALFGGPVTKAAHEDAVKARYGKFADEILASFPASGGDGTQGSRDLATDVMFGWHTLDWAMLQTKKSSKPVYLYYFDNKPPYPAGNRLASAKGAPHASELPYVFDHLDQQPTMPWRPEDRTISAAMAGYWTNFAKTGDPNGPGLPKWPAFSSAAPEAMIFRGSPQAGALPDPKHFDVLDRYFAWRRSPEGAQQ